MTRLLILALATGLALPAHPALSQRRPTLSVTVQAEAELPAMPTERMGGVTVHFRAAAQPAYAQVLGPVRTGIVGSSETEAFGFQPAEAPSNSRIVACPANLRAAVVKLTEAAKSMGADAVIDVHSVEHDPGHPSYLCMITRDTRLPLRDPKANAYGVSLEGVAVKKAATQK